MLCHDKLFTDVDLLDGAGNKVFTLGSKNTVTTWTMKRTLRDATGNLALCKAKGNVLGKGQTTKIEATVLSDTGDKKATTLLSGDHAGIETTYEVEGATIAELQLVKNNNLSSLRLRRLDRSTWKLKAKAGTNSALIAALAVCRAAVLQAWRR